MEVIIFVKNFVDLQQCNDVFDVFFADDGMRSTGTKTRSGLCRKRSGRGNRRLLWDGRRISMKRGRLFGSRQVFRRRDFRVFGRPCLFRYRRNVQQLKLSCNLPRSGRKRNRGNAEESDGSTSAGHRRRPTNASGNPTTCCLMPPAAP